MRDIIQLTIMTFVACAYIITGSDILPYDQAWLAVEWILVALLFQITALSTSPLWVRSFFSVMLIYEFNVAMTDTFLGAFPSWLYPIEISLLAGWLMWSIARPLYDYPGDKIDNEHVFVTFYRPTGFMDTIVSLVGLPFSSTGVYADGKWLRFKRGLPDLQLLKVRPTKPKYVSVNTGVKLTPDLKLEMVRLKGAPARHWTSLFLRMRCVVTLRPILKQLGPQWEPRWYEFIPGLYAFRRTTHGHRRRN